MKPFLLGRVYFNIILIAILTMMLPTSFAQIDLEANAAVSEYTIGVEDVLTVFVWKEEDLNKTVIVRPDGKISFPLVSDLVAEGMTCQQLAEKIKDKLLVYIKEPNVSVILDEINSFKVYVLGEVNSQGVYILKSSARLLQVLAMAEGLNEFADKSDIVVIRHEKGKERRIKLDYKRIISGAKPEDNIYIKPGDTIIVN